MNTEGVPAITEFRPPEGTTFYTCGLFPISTVSRDLCKVAAFMQQLAPYATLIRYEDWWEHDGLHFERERLDFHGLFHLVGTARDLLAATPHDDQVYVGIAPKDRSWYLRFCGAWDDKGEKLLGEFSLTLPDVTAARFRSDVVGQLECAMKQENSRSHFQNISPE